MKDEAEKTEKTFLAERNIHACAYGPPPEREIKEMIKGKEKNGKGGIISKIGSKIKIQKGNSKK